MYKDIIKEDIPDNTHANTWGGGFISTTYMCDKHGKVDLVMSFNIGPVHTVYCLLCLHDLLAKNLPNIKNTKEDKEV
jgi:hypothetical protein